MVAREPAWDKEQQPTRTMWWDASMLFCIPGAGYKYLPISDRITLANVDISSS